jgi:hypothetical protein
MKEFCSLTKNARRKIVFAKLKLASAVVALICLAIWSTTNSASAITLDVARKCDALAYKAFPPSVVGNPAAGSAKGTSQDERNYFGKCVANGGNVDDQNSGNQDSGNQDHKDAK